MRRKASWTILAILTSATAWGCGDAQPASESGEDAADVSLPSGYALRLDRLNRNPADFRVTETPTGLTIVTGPSGILYRSADAVTSGDYMVSATFTEIAAPRGHREGFGLFIGGQDLEGPNQRYTYFLVRADGSYLIKRRSGDATANVSDGWIEAEAIARAGTGDVVNELIVQVTGDQVGFHCNGTRLAELSTDQVEPHGIAGLRVNHNLRVEVEDFLLAR